MRSSIRALVALATSLSLAVGVHGANDTNGLACPVTSGSEDGAFFSVVGVQGTGVHPRLELRELEKDPEMFNLFIQAFAKFQAMDQKEKLSYFRIASKILTVLRLSATNIRQVSTVPPSTRGTMCRHKTAGRTKWVTVLIQATCFRRGIGPILLCLSRSSNKMQKKLHSSIHRARSGTSTKMLRKSFVYHIGIGLLIRQMELKAQCLIAYGDQTKPLPRSMAPNSRSRTRSYSTTFILWTRHTLHHW